MSEAETGLRGEGLSWDVVSKAFRWYQLSVDFMRQMIEYDPVYKTQLQHQLIMDLNGWSIHSSVYYQNMYQYIKAGLGELKELELYEGRVYQLYKVQKEQQYNSRIVYKAVDGMGRTLDQWVM